MKTIILTAAIWCLIDLSGIMAQDSTNAERSITYNNSEGLIKDLADPHVFEYEGKYYLYGTSAPKKGFKVFSSKDLVNWENAGFALHKKDVWGDKGFWAPEVIHHNNKFYMFYTVDSHIAVATSDSPLGPFTQPEKGPLNPDINEIDPNIFIEKDSGKAYLYFCRFNQGNIIFGAELTEDLMSVKQETITKLIEQTEEWEHTDNNPNSDWPVTEAPSVIKRGEFYYLFYTANHFKNPDYAVGYAISQNPLGPFKKSQENPVISSTEKLKGTGTTSIVTAPNNESYIFYHTHRNQAEIFPRKTVMDRLEFLDQSKGKPDVVKVHGPTSSPQDVDWLKR